MSSGRMRRRSFLALGAAGAGLAASTVAQRGWTFGFLEPLQVDNPLAQYPNRGWEDVYRDLYAYDSTFTFTCAPNDTHNCLLTAYVRAGTVVRIGPTFGYGEAMDLGGGRASHRWDPRCCQKGLGLVRRFYGDRRCKYPLVRKGWLEWARAGMPRDPATGKVDPKYLQRGKEPFVRVGWDEAYELVAKGLKDVASAYNGDEGKRRLVAQGFDPVMTEAMKGAGTQTIKIRGGMPMLGILRIIGLYRLANGLALLDVKTRGVKPEDSLGARGWDSYTWHTDLPPGHPMVSGQQTVEWDLSCTEYSKLVIAWGMNWITTKMPDAHWLTEARLKGAKVAVIACEYSATMNKADLGLVVRPGTTPALALGLAHVILRDGLQDDDFVRNFTDMPSLVRMDTLEVLRAKDVKGMSKDVSPGADVIRAGSKAPRMVEQKNMVIPESLEGRLDPFVVWDEAGKRPVRVTRTECGKKGRAKTGRAALTGSFQVELADGNTVECRPVFDLVHKYVMDNFDPKTVEEITWAPQAGIEALAKEIANNREKTLFACGMGPNQFFNNDLKDRTVMLLASLTRNIGFPGGNVGSYAGNYRTALFNGLGQYVFEDPFDLEPDTSQPARIKYHMKYESAHWWNYGDKPLKMGKELVTGKGHIPTPTKVIWVSNSNSLIGNAKHHYEAVMNHLPRQEMVVVNEWWWTASCEYADVVFPVDSWAEFKYADMTASVTNPFVNIFPRTPLARIYDTRSDVECIAGVANALAKVAEEPRIAESWKFVAEGRTHEYMQRVMNASNMTAGIDFLEAERDAQRGVPTIIQSRTYPKSVGWEQSHEDKPWYTRTGRLEFFREEPEWRDSGESLPVHREPIDSTFYEPNVIVAKPHPAIRPKGPEAYGVPLTQLDCETRQTRHVAKPWTEVSQTRHPLTAKDGAYRFIFHTPKYRHGAHTTPVDTDIVAIWFGPFGDMLRHDERTPFVTEMYVDIHPADAKALEVADGDYVYIDADPEDRPFRGWQARGDDHKMARLLCRARYYPGTPRGITRMWHNAYGSTYGSVRGHAEHPTKMAKNPETGYQSLFRAGSQQSCTRAWIKPTLVTDTLLRKDVFGQSLGVGFAPDVHCPNGAPRESMARIQKAEAGGIGGKGLWRPAAQGLTPSYENDALKKFIAGGFVAIK
ncbi:MAG: molybdopterin-dependent oxidoreductase [Polyangiaceae bacterium]|nr:molybdopterin-dependent oxidoreductase [Polyangiaceae bacterium]